jgi:hypothetical protein
MAEGHLANYLRWLKPMRNDRVPNAHDNSREPSDPGPNGRHRDERIPRRS